MSYVIVHNDYLKLPKEIHATKFFVQLFVEIFHHPYSLQRTNSLVTKSLLRLVRIKTGTKE